MMGVTSKNTSSDESSVYSFSPDSLVGEMKKKTQSLVTCEETKHLKEKYVLPDQYHPAGRKLEELRRLSVQNRLRSRSSSIKISKDKNACERDNRKSPKASFKISAQKMKLVERPVSRNSSFASASFEKFRKYAKSLLRHGTLSGESNDKVSTSTIQPNNKENYEKGTFREVLEIEVFMPIVDVERDITILPAHPKPIFKRHILRDQQLISANDTGRKSRSADVGNGNKVEERKIKTSCSHRNKRNSPRSRENTRAETKKKIGVLELIRSIKTDNECDRRRRFSKNFTTGHPTTGEQRSKSNSMDSTAKQNKSDTVNQEASLAAGELLSPRHSKKAAPQIKKSNFHKSNIRSSDCAHRAYKHQNKDFNSSIKNSEEHKPIIETNQRDSRAVDDVVSEEMAKGKKVPIHSAQLNHKEGDFHIIYPYIEPKYRCRKTYKQLYVQEKSYRQQTPETHCKTYIKARLREDKDYGWRNVTGRRKKSPKPNTSTDNHISMDTWIDRCKYLQTRHQTAGGSRPGHNKDQTWARKRHTRYKRSLPKLTPT